MSNKRLGSTICLQNYPVIIGHACVVGPKEGKGPLGSSFDFVSPEETFGEKTWEKSEKRLQTEAFNRAVSKSGLPESELQMIFAGDLQNQCTASSFAFRDKNIPFAGLYGACSTMAESLALAACMLDGDILDNAVCVTSSHFCSAEKQYRFPLEYGGQRTPSAQWTVTGSGACVLAQQGEGVKIKRVRFGKIIDYGITDANNMGAAMAPESES